MKKLSAGIAFLSVVSMLACTQAPPPSAAKPTAWVFNITPQTTIHDIDSVTMAWKKDSIELKFKKLEFTDAGKLLKIKGSMTIIPRGTPNGSYTSDSLVSYKLEVDNHNTISISGK